MASDTEEVKSKASSRHEVSKAVRGLPSNVGLTDWPGPNPWASGVKRHTEEVERPLISHRGWMTCSIVAPTAAHYRTAARERESPQPGTKKPLVAWCWPVYAICVLASDEV
jgi:hypothetical protein